MRARPPSEQTAPGADDETVAAVWRALRTVTDPEIPVLDIVELGIVRSVDVADGRAAVTITPTFAACPALDTIARDVASAVASLGLVPEVRTTLHPPWTSDDMSDAARATLAGFGIAPPSPHAGLVDLALDEPVPCPRCANPHTALRNAFGSALCREIRTCSACGETFERFKPV